MNDESALLRRLKARRIAVDLSTLNASPQKAITVVGLCFSALRAAGVPKDEIKAFMNLTTRRARDAAEAGEAYPLALEQVLNEQGFEMLAIAQGYFDVTANWDPASGPVGRPVRP